MKVRIQCVGCGEKFKFIAEAGRRYDFVCPNCKTGQSFETPGARNWQTQEIRPIQPAPPRPPAVPEEPSTTQESASPDPFPVKPDGRVSLPPGLGECTPPPKMEFRLKKDGKDKLGSILKWSVRLILAVIISWVSWLVWKNFLDPGGKVAWKTDLKIVSFHLLSNEKGKIRFFNDGKVMELDSGTGKVTVTAELPDYAKYPRLLTECGGNRAVFAAGEQGKVHGAAAGREIAMMDFSGRKLWSRSFSGNVRDAVCGDDIMIVQTVEPVSKKRDEAENHDYIYRVNAIRMSDGGDVWTRGPQTNERILNDILAGGKMMLSRSFEADKPETKEGGEIVLTVSGLATGKVVWEVRTRDHLDWGPFIRGGALIFKQKDKLTALNINDGSKLWELEVPGLPDVNGGSPLESNAVYFVSENRISAVDLKTGRKLWENQYETAPDISLVSDKFVFLGSVREKPVESLVSEIKLPPAYEQLKEEEPDLFGNALNTSIPKVRYENGIVCLEAVSGKRLWDVRKIFGQVAARGNRIVVFWDSADTTIFGGLNRAGKTVVRQYSARNGKLLFDRNDDVALAPPYLVCGRKFITMFHDRAAGSGSTPSGFVGFNLK